MAVTKPISAKAFCVGSDRGRDANVLEAKKSSAGAGISVVVVELVTVVVGLVVALVTGFSVVLAVVSGTIVGTCSSSSEESLVVGVATGGSVVLLFFFLDFFFFFLEDLVLVDDMVFPPRQDAESQDPTNRLLNLKSGTLSLWDTRLYPSQFLYLKFLNQKPPKLKDNLWWPYQAF